MKICVLALNMSPLPILDLVVLFYKVPSFTLGLVSLHFFHSSTSKRRLHLSALSPLWSMQFLSHYFESVPCSWVWPRHFDSVYCLLNEVEPSHSRSRSLLSGPLRRRKRSREPKPQASITQHSLERTRERPHVADYEINIHDKPLKPQNYFMRATVAEFHHWEKYHIYSAGFLFLTKDERNLKKPCHDTY